MIPPHTTSKITTTNTMSGARDLFAPRDATNPARDAGETAATFCDADDAMGCEPDDAIDDETDGATDDATDDATGDMLADATDGETGCESRDDTCGAACDSASDAARDDPSCFAIVGAARSIAARADPAA
jgi:hypothetical protein